MKILAIDTSSSICGTALLENDILIDENILDDGKTHSENLMPLVDELLKRNNIDISQIEMIACTVGPGSFTGIRIGVSCIKAIAEVLKIKVASVTSLEVLAQNIENTDIKVSIIDARNNQVYCGIFDKENNKIGEYIADDINKVIEKLKEYNNITVTGNGSIIHKELLESSIENIKFSDENRQLPYACGKVGYKKFQKNELCTPDELIPIYLRKSQAERMKQNNNS